MGSDTKQAALLARILIAKHGSNAASEAAERLLHWVKAGDLQTARLWIEVVQIAMTPTSVTEQPQLAEVLDEPVTRAVMDSDSVTREDVQTVLADTKARLRRKS
jgi:hypothetical protein